jgi:DNA-binding CsgD family transcriptional regulator
MDYKLNSKQLKEMKLLTDYILKGMNNQKIAEKLKYSRSTIGYKINKLFCLFNSTNRIEFVLKVTEKLIKTKNTKIANLNKKLKLLEKENLVLKEKISNLLSIQNRHADKIVV